jgi:hypothetical protein
MQLTNRFQPARGEVNLIHLTADPRRQSQTVFFSPDDLSGEKPACPSGKQVLKMWWYPKVANFNSVMHLYKHININNRIAIGEFFAAQVARQNGMPCEMRSLFHRGLRPSA